MKKLIVCLVLLIGSLSLNAETCYYYFGTTCGAYAYGSGTCNMPDEVKIAIMDDLEASYCE